MYFAVLANEIVFFLVQFRLQRSLLQRKLEKNFFFDSNKCFVRLQNFSISLFFFFKCVVQVVFSLLSILLVCDFFVLKNHYIGDEAWFLERFFGWPLAYSFSACSSSSLTLSLLDNSLFNFLFCYISCFPPFFPVAAYALFASYCFIVVAVGSSYVRCIRRFIVVVYKCVM